MSEIATLVVRPDGICTGLYTEVIDLSKLGILSIRRATTIEFDNNLQAWRVRDRSGSPLFRSSSRETCLKWEREYFAAKNRGTTCGNGNS